MKKLSWRSVKIIDTKSPVRTAAVTLKELSWYFNNLGGFILIAIFSGLSNFLFFKDFFVNGNDSARPFFSLLPWLLIFLTSALSMRTFAEEKRNGTLEVLLSLPLTETEIVLGKFIAALIVVAATLTATLTVPITLLTLGRPDSGIFVTGYLGSLLLASAMLSIGIFFSSVSGNQVVSLLASIAVLFLLTVLGQDLVLQQVPRFLADALTFLSLTTRFNGFAQGLIDWRDVTFFLTVSLAFIFLTIADSEKRN